MSETSVYLTRDFTIVPLAIINAVVVPTGVTLAVGRIVLHRGDTVAARRWADILHCTAVAVYITFLCLNCRFWVILREPQLSNDLQRSGTPHWLRSYELARAWLFYTGLYLVKSSFLMLYRSLFAVDQSFRAAWWGVLTFVVLTYLLLLGGAAWRTFASGTSYFISDAANHSVSFGTCIVGIMLNVTSDLAVMALPLGMLRTLQMPLPKKLDLAVVFLLSCNLVVLDLMRLLGSDLQFGGELFTNLESGIAVILCGLPVYRSVVLGWMHSLGLRISELLRPSQRRSSKQPASHVADRNLPTMPRQPPAVHSANSSPPLNYSNGSATPREISYEGAPAALAHGEVQSPMAPVRGCGRSTILE